MSYEIIYDKQFVKVGENKFVPMVYAGSSNCYEFSPSGKERRSRSWCSMRISDKLAYTLEEMVSYAENLRQGIIDRNNKREKDEWFDEYSDKDFGYWSAIAINGKTRNTTYGQFKGVFVTGAKKALTIEELGVNNISVIITESYMGKERSEIDIPKFYKRVNCSEDFEEVVNDFNETFKDTKIRPIVEYSGMYDETAKWLRKKYFSKPKREKVAVEVDKFYTIYVVGVGYFDSLLRGGGYRYSIYSARLKYETEKEAKRKLNYLHNKTNFKFEIQEINEKTTLYK